IRARRRSWWRRANPWSRGRNRFARALLIILVLGTLLLATFSFVVVRKTKAMRQMLLAEQVLAEQQHHLAEKNRELARKAVDDLLTKSEQDLSRLPQIEATQRSLLEEALRFYEGSILDPGAAPDKRRRTADAYRRMGAIHQRLGQNEKAE